MLVTQKATRQQISLAASNGLKAIMFSTPWAGMLLAYLLNNMPWIQGMILLILQQRTL